MQRVIDIFSDAFDLAMDVVNDAITFVGDTISDIVGAIKGFFDDFIRAASDLATKVANFLGDMFKPLVEGIQNAVGLAKDIWNGFVRFWNGFELVIPAIAVGDFQITPRLVFGLPDLPMLAKGVRGFAGGLAIVGEEGPEVVRLPRGSDVFSAAQSAAMMRGGMGRTAVGTMNVYGLSEYEVEQAVIRADRRLALEWNL
jgi:hypothetical protein